MWKIIIDNEIRYTDGFSDLLTSDLMSKMSKMRHEDPEEITMEKFLGECGNEWSTIEFGGDWETFEVSIKKRR